MSSIEININKQKYVLKGDETQEHLEEIATLVLRKIESIKKLKPGMSFQKVAILAALDFASQTIEGKKRSRAYQTAVLSKANDLLHRVESSLANPPAQH